jgi:hypothetical protein
MRVEARNLPPNMRSTQGFIEERRCFPVILSVRVGRALPRSLAALTSMIDDVDNVVVLII